MWFRKGRIPRIDVAQIDPDPLRTPDDALETGMLIGMLDINPWEAVAIKNLKDRHISSQTTDELPTVRGAGQVAGRAAGKRAGT